MRKCGQYKFLIILIIFAFFLTACEGQQKEIVALEEAETIKIGGLAPLTGPVAVYGKTASNGAKLAVEEINANGGIFGKPIDFNLQDEQGNLIEAVNAYNKMYSDGYYIIWGDVTSGPTEAVAELANTDEVVLLTPSGTQDGITIDRDFAFRVCYTDSYQGHILARFASENLEVHTAALMTNNSSDYSDGVARTFKETAKDLGIEIVAEESYGNQDTDFSAQLTNISRKNPDVLVIPDYYEVIAMIAPQARQAGIESVFLGPDGWDGVLDQLAGDTSAVEGAYFTSHYSVDDPKEELQNFLRNYDTTFTDPVSAFSALGYDGVYMLKEAIETAESLDPVEVQKTLKSIEFEGITGYLTYDDNNNPIKDVSVIIIKDGEYSLDSVVSPE